MKNKITLEGIKRVCLNHIIPIIFFLGLTVLFNHHLVSNFTSTIEKNDGRLLAWTLAWDNHILLSNPSQLFDANIYYPNENTLTYSEHAIGTSLLSLPFYIASNGNPAIGFNSVLLLSFFLNGLFTYYLVMYITKNRYAGLLGGLIFGFCCYKIWNIGHLQNLVIFYIPLMLLFLMKYVNEKKKAYLIIIGGALLMQSLSSWYHMIFIHILYGLFVLYYLWRKQLNLKDLIWLGGTNVAAFALILPLALPYFKFNKANGSAYSMREAGYYSADFGGYLIPSPSTFIGDRIMGRLRITKTRWGENFNFVGYTTLLLSILGFIKFTFDKGKATLSLKLTKSRLIFALVAVIFFVLSFGPVLHFNDKALYIPLPYAVIYTILPPIRFIRAVSRYSTVVFLMLGILAGFGLVEVMKRFKSEWVKFGIFALVTAVCIFEYYPYRDYTQYADISHTPAIYQEVKNNPDVKSIVELPINVDPFETTGYIYYAGIHFKKLVNGYSGFEPKSYPIIKGLLTDNVNDAGAIKLNEIGVTHVLLNPTYKGEPLGDSYTLIKESEGYKLYAVEKNVTGSFYIDHFDGNVYSNKFEKPAIKQDMVSVKTADAGTPFANVSPTQLDVPGSLLITSPTAIKSLKIAARAYSANDTITVECGVNKQVITNTTQYLETPLVMTCGSNDVRILMRSSSFLDRSLVKSLSLYGE